MRELAAETAENIKKSLKLDTRFVVFDYEIAERAKFCEIRFLISSKYIAEGISSFFEKYASALKGEVIPSIELIPGKEEATFPAAICNVSVAPIMAQASHASEQVTQILLGETADILQRSELHWTRIRLHSDGYIGWVSSNQIVRCVDADLKEWANSMKVTPSRLLTRIHSGPSRSTDIIREFLQGTALPVKTARGGWTTVRLPDKTVGHLPSAECAIAEETISDCTSAQIIKTARSFLGISYLWGGRSVKGFDCSGFAQTVFRLNGIEIPRDAPLQWTCGEEVGKEPSLCAEGDLLFFSLDGVRVTHVGIALGTEEEYIHASGYVRINSLHPAHPLYDQHRASTYVGARRLGRIE